MQIKKYNDTDKIQQMLDSADKEMQDLGIILFHTTIDSKWKGDIFSETIDHIMKVDCTRARLRVYLKKDEFPWYDKKKI